MARRLRVDIEGGLYNLIARCNDRQNIFHSKEEQERFITLLIKEKARSAFFLYAYCLMTNHIHLLIERQEATVGNIMQRVLGGYSRYYNGHYKHPKCLREGIRQVFRHAGPLSLNWRFFFFITSLAKTLLRTLTGCRKQWSSVKQESSQREKSPSS